MQLNNQKRIASKLLKRSKKRVVFDTERTEEIKEAITKEDIRGLIKDKAIIPVQSKGVSRVRAKKKDKQKKKGNRKGYGSRKGTKKTREDKKRTWMNKVRLQREFIKLLREKKIIEIKVYSLLYKKVKGGFFRSKNHIKIYINEQRLVKNE